MRMWRTLIRILGETPDGVRVVLPGWDIREVVTIPRDQFPYEPREGYRCHARVNLSARNPEDLVFEGWEET